ncbi:hypothetical protein ACCAA_50117 [Candidatus Accumulibacter aalborgensis]|uniref:DUF4145 domain-containing protein n=1 Tax=Candidatus Accumulibacter aalborgensis TaxID=1860102 RepID=A0A1A8XRZ3_9PROT|nr:hypothetical protein [Candidatus Accumulibacter aalborgensis]SBT07884.1 hypothetical protein ACCAA_50117 [Candidatus Accumulibacter aalborgensis]
MIDATDDLKDRLLVALVHSDAESRSDRANRLVWLSRFMQPSEIISGRLEPLSLLEEARVCYVNGHYIAVLLTATAFIEQTLVEELEDLAIIGPRETLAKATETARKAELFSVELLAATDDLRKIRNPFAHRKPDDHTQNLSTRFRVRKMHPKSVLEEDAQHAIETMYEYFSLTLKPA